MNRTGPGAPHHPHDLVEREVGPRVLGKFQQKNAFRILGGVLPGTTKEQGLAALEQAAAQLLPASYSIDYAGESRQLRQEERTKQIPIILLTAMYIAGSSSTSSSSVPCSNSPRLRSIMLTPVG